MNYQDFKLCNDWSCCVVGYARSNKNVDDVDDVYHCRKNVSQERWSALNFDMSEESDAKDMPT